MSKDFEGKAVIVTGSSSGIGEAIAILFAQRGAMVTLCGRDQGRLQEAVEKCRKAGGDDKPDKYISVCGDVTDKEVREKIVEATVEKFGRLDVLVCNHGTVRPVLSIADETEDSYDVVMNTNVKSVYFLIQKSVQYLEKTQGSIVNVSSIASKKTGGATACYSISKAALDHMTRCLALELAGKSIRVNAINPTLVMTRITRTFDQQLLTPEILEQVASYHPLHGRASTAEEQAEVVVFLASTGANFVTGQCVSVDGGMTLAGSRIDRPQ